MAHDQPTYASVPGIRVFGMMCVKPDGQHSTPNGSNGIIQRPLPPKRNQYFQAQSSYYQRYKKHALSKLSAQQKIGDAQLPDASDFTTRGINVASNEPENRESVDSDEDSGEMPSSTFDPSSGSFSPTTVTTIDASSAEQTTPTVHSVNRAKRTTDKKIDANSDSDEQVTIENEHFESSSRSRHTDDWPEIPWNEIRKTIKEIQWI